MSKQHLILFVSHPCACLLIIHQSLLTASTSHSSAVPYSSLFVDMSTTPLGEPATHMHTRAYLHTLVSYPQHPPSLLCQVQHAHSRQLQELQFLLMCLTAIVIATHLTANNTYAISTHSSLIHQVLLTCQQLFMVSHSCVPARLL